MKKKISLLIILVIFLLCSACIFSDWYFSFMDNPWAWFSGIEPVADTVSQDTDLEGIEEDIEHLEGVDDVVIDLPKEEIFEEEEAEEEEDDPFFEDIPPMKIDTLEVLLDYHGFTENQKDIIFHMYQAGTDRHRDYLYHIALATFGPGLSEVDLRGFSKVLLRYSDEARVFTFGNTLFPCDSEIEGGFVVCADDPLPIETGDVHMFVMQMDAEIPVANPDLFYTYSVVVDADGDPSNNFEFTPPYDWDFYQNTDRWFMLDWNPDLGDWSVGVVDVVQDIYPYPSAVRAVVIGDIVAFFIPTSEFSVDNPGYRVTAFGHDGTFSQESSCGDVSGANPTEPLITTYSELIMVE